VKVAYETQNLSELTSYESYISRFGNLFSKLDIAILINNAGIGFTGPYDNMSL